MDSSFKLYPESYRFSPPLLPPSWSEPASSPGGIIAKAFYLISLLLSLLFSIYNSTKARMISLRPKSDHVIPLLKIPQGLPCHLDRYPYHDLKVQYDFAPYYFSDLIWHCSLLPFMLLQPHKAPLCASDKSR